MFDIIKNYKFRREMVSYFRNDFIELDENVGAISSLGQLGIEDNEMTQEGLNPFQKALSIIYKKIADRKWKRYGNACYEETFACKVTDLDENTYFVLEENIDKNVHEIISRHKTYCWKKIESIKLVIDKELVTRQTDFELWKLLTSSSSMLNQVTEGLKDWMNDGDFQQLELCRHARSFRNGVLLLLREGAKFLPYDTDSRVFSHYGLTSEIMSTRYYDMDFHSFSCFPHDPLQIPTPGMQTILDLQKFNPATCRVIYGMIGRLLHKLGTYDKWHVMPLFLGQAQTGKSSIGSIVQQMFKSDDVGTIDSGGEEVFKLQAIYDKSVWICYEVTKNFNLPDSYFLSMVSGDSMNIPVKSKAPVILPKWEVPGICFGNEMASWNDKQGNFVRRILFISFKHSLPPHQKDTDLQQKIERLEMGLLIAKCHNCYMYMLDQIADRDIWTCLPSFFLQEKEKMERIMNPLKAFVESNVFIRGDDKVMALEDFRERVVRHFNESNGVRRMLVRESDLENVCISLKLRWEKKTLPWHVTQPGRDGFRSDVYIFGMGFNDNMHSGGDADDEEESQASVADDQNVIADYEQPRAILLV